MTRPLRRKTAGGLRVERDPISDTQGNVGPIGLGSARDVSEREELREGSPRSTRSTGRRRDRPRDVASPSSSTRPSTCSMAVTSADRAAMLLLDDEDVMRFVAWRGLSDAYREQTEGHSPWSADAVDPEPVLVEAARPAGFEPRSRRAVQAEGIVALSFIPLVHGDRLLGKFMLYRDSPHDLGRPRGSALQDDREPHRVGNRADARADRAPRDHASSSRRSCARSTRESPCSRPTAELVYANEAAARAIGFERRAGS